MLASNARCPDVDQTFSPLNQLSYNETLEEKVALGCALACFFLVETFRSFLSLRHFGH